jgi:hypothetical protein
MVETLKNQKGLQNVGTGLIITVLLSVILKTRALFSCYALGMPMANLE